MTKPNGTPTPRKTHRAFRIPDDLYAAARAKAAGRGETLTSVVCKALERYVRSGR